MRARQLVTLGAAVVFQLSQTPRVGAQSSSCSVTVSHVQQLRIDFIADQATADQIDKLIRGQQPPTVGQLNDLINDLARSLQAGAQHTEDYMAQVGNRISALKLPRQGRIWPEHTKSVREAGRQLRSDVARLSGTDRAYTYVNGKASSARGVDAKTARVSASTRSSAATEPFNKMMQSANGFWKAAEATTAAANQSGLSTALAGEDSFQQLATESLRIGENVDMLKAVQGLDAGTTQALNAVTSAMQGHLSGAKDMLAKVEQLAAAACPQQMQNQQNANSSQTPRGISNSGAGGGGHGGAIAAAVVLPAAAVGGYLVYDKYKCGTAPDLSALTPSNVAACRSSVKTALDKIIAFCDCATSGSECSGGTRQNYLELKRDCGW